MYIYHTKKLYYEKERWHKKQHSDRINPSILYAHVAKKQPTLENTHTHTRCFIMLMQCMHEESY